MTATTARFVIVTRSAAAPKSGGGKYRRPVHVRVLDSRQSEWHAVRGYNDGVKAEWSNVDSRYTGPRSAYGQALAAARELVADLNLAEEYRDVPHAD